MEREFNGDRASDLIPVDEASPPTPPHTPPSSDYRVVELRRSYRFGSYTTKGTYKASQVVKKREAQKSSARHAQLAKGFNKTTGVVVTDGSTADIPGYCWRITGTAVREVENRTNSSDILNPPGGIVQSQKLTVQTGVKAKRILRGISVGHTWWMDESMTVKKLLLLTHIIIQRV
jgi:hypothetical protein